MIGLHQRDLELYCEIVTQRSFSHAARNLGVSQSVASETVKSLEDRFGLELLKRTRPLEVTPAGQIYYDGCRTILDSFERLNSRMLQLHDKVVGPVRVAAIYSVGLLQMDSYVREFERRYPDAVLELRYLHPDEVVRRVADDEADLGLISFPQRRGDLNCIPWQEQPIVLVVPPNHRLAPRSLVEIQEISDEPFVTFIPSLRIRSEIDRWLKQARVHVDVTHEFDNIETIKRAVEIGSGLALLPLPTVRRECEIGSLTAIGISNVDWVRPLGIIHRRGKELSPAVNRFLDLLKSSTDAALTLKDSGKPGALPVKTSEPATSSSKALN